MGLTVTQLTLIGLTLFGVGTVNTMTESINMQLALDRPNRPTQQYRGLFDYLKRVKRSEGVRGYFKGGGSLLLCYISQTALNSLIKSQLSLKQQLSYDRYHRSKLSSSARYHLSDFVLYRSIGTLTQLVSYPLSTIAVRLADQRPSEADDDDSGGGSGGDKVVQYREYEHYNMLSAAMSIMDEGGILAFYRGFHLHLFSDVAQCLCTSLFGSWINRALRASIHDPEMVDEVTPSIGDVIGFWLASLVVDPMNLIVRRMQSQDPAYANLGVIETAQKIYREEGFTGFYKGISYYLIRSLL